MQRDRGSDNHTKSAEITSGKSYFQQCGQQPAKTVQDKLSRNLVEDLGLAHEVVRATKKE